MRQSSRGRRDRGTTRVEHKRADLPREHEDWRRSGTLELTRDLSLRDRTMVDGLRITENLDGHTRGENLEQEYSKTYKSWQ